MTLPGGGGELRGVAEAALQFALDGGGALLPAGRRPRHVLGIGYSQHVKVRAAEQGVQVGAGREVVALRRIVQLAGDGQIDKQADPAAGAHHAAHLEQHGQLGFRSRRGAQDTQGPGQADRAVRERQRGRIGLDDGRAEGPGRRTACVRLRFDQDQPGAGPADRVGGGAADARPDVQEQVTGPGPQPRQQPVQGHGLPASPAGGRHEVLRAQVGGHLSGPLGHGVELGLHRVVGVTGHGRVLPGCARPIRP